MRWFIIYIYTVYNIYIYSYFMYILKYINNKVNIIMHRFFGIICLPQTLEESPVILHLGIFGSLQ